MVTDGVKLSRHPTNCSEIMEDGRVKTSSLRRRTPSTVVSRRADRSSQESTYEFRITLPARRLPRLLCVFASCRKDRCWELPVVCVSEKPSRPRRFVHLKSKPPTAWGVSVVGSFVHRVKGDDDKTTFKIMEIGRRLETRPK